MNSAAFSWCETMTHADLIIYDLLGLFWTFEWNEDASCLTVLTEAFDKGEADVTFCEDKTQHLTSSEHHISLYSFQTHIRWYLCFSSDGRASLLTAVWRDCDSSAWECCGRWREEKTSDDRTLLGVSEFPACEARGSHVIFCSLWPHSVLWRNSHTGAVWCTDLSPDTYRRARRFCCTAHTPVMG